MATDVARLSFDPGRFYRGVVPQQGRVSLEAEQNEQRLIDSDERRKELLDIVGPAGTPDDGYAVSQGNGLGLKIGTGTMYVGGWRVELDEPVDTAAQPDWLDASRDQFEAGREHVLLWVQDTDVTAVEDPALYEVALGGPDGAARTRLLQRFLRLPTDGSTCADALGEDRKRWTESGLTLDPSTMQLASNSRLLVTWEGDPEPPNPCEPSSTGGYLGAENQLVRVQITDVGRDGTFEFVWGYDDASFLYRVTADTSADPVLTLDRTPVDDYHRPRAGQPVQALRATANLASVDGTVEGYVAAQGGEVAVLTAPYDPDTKTVQFPAPLPAGYTDETNPQLYLRVWEELVQGAQPGDAISLTGTGLQITVTSDPGGPLHVDDFWCIGVRPATPTAVYPERFLREAQPPDGPHQWICPLAVIEWQREELVIVEDCRNHFRPLIDIDRTGCCTVEVRPSDSARLQDLIDKAAAGRVVSDRGSRVTVCFEPGRYELTAPLVLQRQHSNLTLHGCNDAAVLSVAHGSEAAFGQGMIVLVDADNLTISGFEFTMPQVPALLARAQGTTGGTFNRDAIRAINADSSNRYVSIALRPINCAELAVLDCLFRFSVGEHHPTLEEAQTMPRPVFGVGIFAAGGAWGLSVRGNRFLHEPTVPVPAEGSPHLLAGYLLTASAASPTSDRKVRTLGAGRVHASIDDAVLGDNEFRGITIALAVAAELGDVSVWDNTVAECYGGIWLVDANAAANADTLSRLGESDATGLAATLLDPVLSRLIMTAALYPLPRLGNLLHRNEVHLGAEQLKQLREVATKGQQAFADKFVARAAAEHPAAEKAQAKPAAKPVTEASAVEFAPALPKGAAAIYAGLSELVRLQHVADLPSQLSIERNTVDCSVPQGESSGPALFVFANLTDVRGPVAAVTSNRLTSLHGRITAVLVGATAVTVTGNTIAGQASTSGISIVGTSGATALGVVAVAAAAITGNVVSGGVYLPENRPFPPPLDTWLPLNTVV